MPVVVLAPDKFRGSADADAVARHLAVGIGRAGAGIETRCVPVADGGEGTVAAALASGYDAVPARVQGPQGRAVDALIAVRDRTAVVELASASGLAVVGRGRLDARTASSFGTGQLVSAALDAGCTDIVVGLGGSACTDGGAGLLEALGARLCDERGRAIGPGGAELERVAQLDLSGLDGRLGAARVVAACDVDNPLLGRRGAARVYGPQKGASAADVSALEAGLSRWAGVVRATTGRDLRGEPGAGAAGGVGFACLSVLGWQLEPGIATILSLLDFDACLQGADLVVTGEGSIDAQTFNGKAPAGVAEAATRAGVPVVAVAGVSRLRAGEWRRIGLRQLYLLSDLEPDPHRSMANAASLLERTGLQLAVDHLPGASA